jgi:hypothetical protein
MEIACFQRWKTRHIIINATFGFGYLSCLKINNMGVCSTLRLIPLQVLFSYFWTLFFPFFFLSLSTYLPYSQTWSDQVRVFFCWHFSIPPRFPQEATPSPPLGGRIYIELLFV